MSASDGGGDPPLVEDFDVLLVAVGILPNVELATEAGIAVDDGIVVDAAGRTSVQDVFGAGEVTNHPVARGGRRARYESWKVAQSQAAAVGSTAAGAVKEYAETPWFWSDQYESNIQMLGHAPPDARWLVRGDHAAHAFTAFSIGADGTIQATIAINAGRDIAGARRLMDRRIAPDQSKLVHPKCEWNVIITK